MEPADRHAALGRTCRHFNPAGFGSGEDCRIGHPIKRIVIKANGGERFGIAYMLPCRPGPERKADCPDYNPRTDEEIAAENARLADEMARFADSLPALELIRSTMVKGRVAAAIHTCPWCNGNRLHVTCAVDFNHHLAAACPDCGMSFRE